MRRASSSEYETASGRLIDLLAPSIDDISLFDVATSLANTRRFNGHSKPYTNAQHSCLVALLLPEEHRIHGLLHDAPEFLTGDLASPVKAALAIICPDFGRAFKYIEKSLSRLIYEKAGVAMPTEEVVALVKAADLKALAIEQRDIRGIHNLWNLPEPPADYRVRPVSSEASFAMFCDALAKCGVVVEYEAQAEGVAA